MTDPEYDTRIEAEWRRKLGLLPFPQKETPVPDPCPGRPAGVPHHLADALARLTAAAATASGYLHALADVAAAFPSSGGAVPGDWTTALRRAADAARQGVAEALAYLSPEAG